MELLRKGDVLPPPAEAQVTGHSQVKGQEVTCYVTIYLSVTFLYSWGSGVIIISRKVGESSIDCVGPR